MLCLLLLACGPMAPEPQPVVDPLVYASPLMGSGGFAYAAGSAFVGAAVPHGLAKPGPDTIGKKYGALRFLHYSGYWAGDETIQGFSQLHLHGTGATDWGALTLAPVKVRPPKTYEPSRSLISDGIRNAWCSAE
jgi:putative alpha-1,2-mannosidase